MPPVNQEFTAKEQPHGIRYIADCCKYWNKKNLEIGSLGEREPASILMSPKNLKRISIGCAICTPKRSEWKCDESLETKYRSRPCSLPRQSKEMPVLSYWPASKIKTTHLDMTEDKDYLLEALNQRFGYGSFLPLQREIIGNVLDQRDSLVVMPTGSGKSICYQLPSLFLNRLTLVVSPLIALMKDQVDALQSRDFRAAFINSTMAAAEQHKVQADTRQGALNILYVAPERLVSPQFQGFVLDIKPSLVAIDEAHCISEWGHDFRPDYRKLQFLRPSLPDTTLIALTATATERVREDILRQLGIPEATRFITSFNRPNLIYDVRPKRNSFANLLGLLQKIGEGSAIVYCSSRQQTEDLARGLSSSGFPALAYHAGLGAEERRHTQDQFMDGRISIVVATIAFGMGIDKPNVRLVVHHDLPKSIEGYYQETGRAGRDSQPSNCVLFFSYRDKSQQDFFIHKIEDEVERANAEKRLELMVQVLPDPVMPPAVPA